MKRRQVILVTYGEPPTAKFGPQLKYSWRVLVGLTRTIAAIPKYLLPLLAIYRGSIRSITWRKERYLSPLESITAQQAAALQKFINGQQSGIDWCVKVAYEFRSPTLTEVLSKPDQAEETVVVPMYVADSDFTHKLSARTVEDLVGNLPPGGARRCSVVSPIKTQSLAHISAVHLEREFTREMKNERSLPTDKSALVLVAHGTPLNPPGGISTGHENTQALGKAILSKFADRFALTQLAWLNHSRGGRWTTPSLEQAFERIEREGIEQVVLFPYGFLADNAETQLETSTIASAKFIHPTLLISCLNANCDLTAALAELVLGASQQNRGAVNSAP